MTEMETKPMARIGDTHVCPLHGTNTIVTGSTNFFIFDRPVARVGDRTECGAIILTGAPDAYDGDRLIAYAGSTTSHGGTITTGSPDAFVSVPKVLPYEIYDQPLEGVPILPISAAAQAVAETVKTIREEGLTPGVVAGAVVGAITRKGSRILPDSKAIKSAKDRAKEVHSVLDPRAQRRRTTAVTETKEGVRVVSSSERRLTPAQRAQLGEDEIEGAGVGHAEVTGINAAKNNGLTPTGTAASRPICSDCASTIRNQSIDILSPTSDEVVK